MSQFKQVDVFTSKKYQGNPVAVFFEADKLTTEDMAKIANWTNLSETTFVLRPTTDAADYKLRIFTPGSELPFAGHPTIGSCHALLEAGLITPRNGKIVQECGAGLVELTINNTISFKLPYYKHTTYEDTDIVLSHLGLTQDQVLKSILVDDGPQWLTFQLKTAREVLNLNPNFSLLTDFSAKSGIVGIDVFGIHEDGSYEARNFAPGDGINEDPVCGSGAGAIGSVLAEEYGITGEVNIKQGCKVKRDGHLKVVIDKIGGKYEINVGGQAVTCINGTY